MNTSYIYRQTLYFDSTEHQNMCLFYFFGSQPWQFLCFFWNLTLRYSWGNRFSLELTPVKRGGRKQDWGSINLDSNTCHTKP